MGKNKQKNKQITSDLFFRFVSVSNRFVSLPRPLLLPPLPPTCRQLFRAFYVIQIGIKDISFAKKIVKRTEYSTDHFDQNGLLRMISFFNFVTTLICRLFDWFGSVKKGKVIFRLSGRR